MGCMLSTLNDSREKRRRSRNVGEIVVFVPGLRTPKAMDFSGQLGDGLSRSLVERLSALRTRIVVMAGEEGLVPAKSRRVATRHGGSAMADLQQALEDYLPVLLGLAQNAHQLQHKLQFDWINQEDDTEETAMSNCWYEVLSVLHLMAMLSLLQANLLLLPKTPADGYQSTVSEESRRASIDIFLKAAGYLDFAIQHVLPQFPPELRKDLPLDLAEGVLRALCLQALSQGVDIQLGMAIDSVKATTAVKRRLACEMVTYWHQAQQTITNFPLANEWGEKHKLFVTWKYIESKVAAYYYHGLILEEGNSERSHAMAATALQAADEFLRESKKACEAFNEAPPLSRNPPVWGTIKYLLEKFPKDASSKVKEKQDPYSHERIMQMAPALPEFALSLKPDEYRFPPVDPSWNNELQGSNLPSTR
ncbi:hypothetical protein VitviT2T_016161 [Vitis vinifera]|uniref:BRO1 domain-containing protein n=3 Tax=Vitis vinifera TaxID=29760 RepID=D7TXY3_VITVI|eukprot:XP_010655979.1 PREDICTED: uncharacterized protein LOC100242158 isoform X1 [Vitis vinifera]